MSVALLLAGSTAELVGSEPSCATPATLGAAGLSSAARAAATRCVWSPASSLFAYPDVAELCRRSPAARLSPRRGDRPRARRGGRRGRGRGAMAAAPTPAAAADAAAAALVAAYGRSIGVRRRGACRPSRSVAIRGKATVRAKRSIGQLEERRTTGAKGDGDALRSCCCRRRAAAAGPPPPPRLRVATVAPRPPNLKELTFSRAPSPSSASTPATSSCARRDCAPPRPPRRPPPRRLLAPPARSPRPAHAPPLAGRARHLRRVPSSRAAPRGTSAASACARCLAPPARSVLPGRRARGRSDRNRGGASA